MKEPGNTSSGESRFLPTLAVLVLIGLPFLVPEISAEWRPCDPRRSRRRIDDRNTARGPGTYRSSWPPHPGVVDHFDRWCSWVRPCWPPGHSSCDLLVWRTFVQQPEPLTHDGCSGLAGHQYHLLSPLLGARWRWPRGENAPGDSLIPTSPSSSTSIPIWRHLAGDRPSATTSTLGHTNTWLSAPRT